MPAIKISPIEKLRRIWTPGSEVEELVHQLDPRTEIDSMIRHCLHAIVQQYGSIEIDLGSERDPVLNEGTLRAEIIHGPGPDEMPEIRRRTMAIWIE